MSEAEIEQLQLEAETLRTRISEAKQNAADTTLADAISDYDLQPLRVQLRCRRTLRAHWGKIYAVHWSANSKNCVSACQDGKMIVWDCYTGNKRALLPLKSIWVMTCAYAPSGHFIASGGLDNAVSIYCLKTRDRKVQRELVGHDAYISCCRFLDDNQVLSSSGDSSCILWDVETGQKVTTFKDASCGGVLCLSLSPDMRSFVTGDTGNEARIWDIREGVCKQTFAVDDHCNSVSFFPSGTAFGTGSDDATARLFDLRSGNEVGFYGHDEIVVGVTSVCFSKSGRLFVCGYDDFVVNVWDTLRQERIGVLAGHENRVNCVTISDDGKGLATGSWDSLVKIWN